MQRKMSCTVASRVSTRSQPLITTFNLLPLTVARICIPEPASLLSGASACITLFAILGEEYSSESSASKARLHLRAYCFIQFLEKLVWVFDFDVSTGGDVMSASEP